MKELDTVKQPPKKDSLPVNEGIRFPRVQLILADGTNKGVVPRDEALRAAYDSELDLVMIAERGNEGFPIVKVMDFGKSLYEKKKKNAVAKKHQKVIQVKEIKIRPKIGDHDFQTKLKQAVQFLRDGKRVKMTLWFRGRENVLKEQHGSVLFDRIHKFFEENALNDEMVSEKDVKMGQFWSRLYYLKTSK